MALKQRHKADELVTNDTTLVRNCNRDKENHKYNSKKYQQPSVTLPPLQYAKWTLLKFKWGTCVPPSPLRGPRLTLNLSRLKRSVVETKTFTAPLESVGFNIVYLKLESFNKARCDKKSFCFIFNSKCWHIPCAAKSLPRSLYSLAINWGKIARNKLCVNVNLK